MNKEFRLIEFLLGQSQISSHRLFSVLAVRLSHHFKK